MEEDKKSVNKEFYAEFLEDTFKSMDSSFEELNKQLSPVFHNKTKFINGILLKRCFKLIANIISSHRLLRREYHNHLQEVKNGEDKKS